MFSIIITTHNSENYIESTLKNVFQATENIKCEIIVVDDGSYDNTLKILQTYKSIQLLHQMNSGVSSARNKGLKYISKDSEFVTFIDDSDWVSNNFFEQSITFFNKYKNIQMAVTPITVVENNNNRDHFLNYRFNKSIDIVNIFENYNYVQFHIGGVVFRSELLFAIEQPFDETINFWEDAKLINNLLLEIQDYGLIKNATYYYNRDDNNSLAKSAWNNKERYSGHIEKNFLSLINQSIQVHDFVIKYVKYVVTIHYLQFLFSHNLQYIDTKYMLEDQRFLLLSQELFTYIDKDTIDKLHINKRYKYFLYKLKNLDISDELNYISVYIHKFKFLQTKIIFSFSEEAFNISDNSDVYIKKHSVDQKVGLLQKYEKDTLHYLSNDFSRNIYQVKLGFKEFFHKNIFFIKDYDNNKIIQVVSDSIFKRICKKLKLYVGRKVKIGR
ncbi:glycosyltransferase family 2 protein [Staphylococcus ureilyticus]|uniref:glycosyltransferase family 2 protein n=1 Tax=Staphylococcus ureilyticus TaxID=94138 RepID=UPI0021A3C324|nr:glycosyltransferase family A protein [Staphylococcus ureilyticus]MCT1915610.1 glycosyltransferase family 2 protein [Staphylococcus ureilyticus]